MLSWQGVDTVVLSLNGLTRRMILTATRANAFDSIVRHGVGLLYQRNYLKCLLFHHPDCQRDCIPLSNTHTPNKHCIIHHMTGCEKSPWAPQARCRVINLCCSLRARSLWNDPATFVCERLLSRDLSFINLSTPTDICINKLISSSPVQLWAITHLMSESCLSNS